MVHIQEHITGIYDFDQEQEGVHIVASAPAETLARVYDAIPLIERRAEQDRVKRILGGIGSSGPNLGA